MTRAPAAATVRAASVSARDLQAPGDELARHDLCGFFLKHPAWRELYEAQMDCCIDEDETHSLLMQWWNDLSNGRLA